jgi:hypothetical protein
MVAASPVFRFRRYREEISLRSSLQQHTNTEKEIKASTNAIVEATNPDNRERARSSFETESGYCDGGDGTVIQNLSGLVVTVDSHGTVSTEKRTSSTKIIDANEESDQSIPTKTGKEKRQGKSICIVPEGTTLLLQNLRDCHVIM